MFPTWFIIAIALLALLVLLFRLIDQIYILQMLKERFFYIFAVAIFIFLAISLTHIHNTYDISLTSFDGIVAAGKIYLSWIVNVFSNLRRITGYALQKDWYNATGGGG